MSENTTFDSDPFAQGWFRYAYIGNWTNPPSKVGQLCVIKMFKDSYTWERTGWDTTMKIYSKAQEYANNFHGGRVEVTNCDVHVVSKNANAPRGTRLGEYVVAEKHLEGDSRNVVIIMVTYQRKQEGRLHFAILYALELDSL